MGTNVILAPTGFPWLSLAAWIVAFVLVWAIGVYGIGTAPTGGSLLIAAMFGNAAFAAALRPR